MTNESEDPVSQLSNLFGSYKAEWLREHIFEYFAEPSYFPELQTPRPCVILGGRGSGKTTTLMGLSYKGQFELTGKLPAQIDQWKFIGIFYRVNTNQVKSFEGPELPPLEWSKYFCHYINLVFCQGILDFIAWHVDIAGEPVDLPSELFEIMRSAFGIQKAANLDELRHCLRHEKLRLEVAVNSISDNPSINLSSLSAPVDELIKQIQMLPRYKGKHFFFLLDEYENFSDEQQRVVNTMIKHSAPLYSFKIGVRELGLRTRETLNPNEHLISPADFVRIDVGEALQDSQFEEFALRVAQERVRRVKLSDGAALTVKSLLPGLTIEQEAERLTKTTPDLFKESKQTLLTALPDSLHDSIDSVSDYFVHFFICYSASAGVALSEEWAKFLKNRSEWNTRYHNYGYAFLFTLRKGKSGIRKYYCGYKTYLALAHGNIRFFLELVERALLIHIKNGSGITDPVSPENQTIGAQEVGRKNLAELEGLSIHGGRMVRLVLNLGRIFQIFARTPFGHAPEQNQFTLKGADDAPAVEINTATEILNDGVNHLALLRMRGTKLSESFDIRSYDYAVHPIFAPFFEFSFRSKRKVFFSPAEIVDLARSESKVRRELLSKRDGRAAEQEALPDQMELFTEFYT